MPSKGACWTTFNYAFHLASIHQVLFSVICINVINFVIHLKTFISEFSLVGENGEAVPATVEGLLLSNGGTVCDDNFNDNAAEAICRQMGYMGKLSWTYGEKWGIQTSKEITLDDVACSTEEWSSCTFSFEHNCGHGEDIFLQCDGVGKSAKLGIPIYNIVEFTTNYQV